MARLTIEDCWWTDPRREKLGKLVGGMENADAHAIRMWRLAQEHWGRGRNLVPQEIFESLEAAPKLIQAGLAKVEAGGVYVKGSSQYIDWLNEKREAGKAGGKKSAQRPRNAKGQLTKTPKQKPSSDQAKPKHSQPSGFGSGSDFGVIQIASQSGELVPLAPVERNPVALWVKAYAEKYGVRYAFQKKDFGFLKNAGEVHGPDRLEVLFACYLAIDEKFYGDAKHPLSLFFRDLQKISVAAQTGINPALPQRFDVSKLKD